MGRGKMIDKFLSLKRWEKATLIIGFILMMGYAFSLPDPLFDASYSTLVSDRNGELLGARIASDGQWRFPPTDSIPDKYSMGSKNRCMENRINEVFGYYTIAPCTNNKNSICI